ncbi:acidic fibroblast growth factor intracellular-binding protein-like [Haliotis cracherodii]|uniref:acidic fibroblast growth factor intracellular-binding protein-like n=1 Tax=Haliotis cracherodii TaxID=6455 RepID=UPI0039E8E847
MVMAEFDIFVGNNTYIDPDVYDMWLRGCSVSEAANVLQKQGVLKKYSATSEDLLSDTQDNYRLFTSLEKLVKSPDKLRDQHIYQINADTQTMLIEKYYQIDAPVIREILGKKLNSRHRKDLDDVSEKTGVMLRSCRRQFDNVKRVFKTVEEMKGSLVENIQTHYLLSGELARSYAAIVFITNNRFETGKKKLMYLEFKDFTLCANYMIANWSYSSIECTEHEDMDVDLDRDFLLQLRELKGLMEREYCEEHKGLLLRSMKGKVSDRAYSDMEANFKNYSKNILNIAYGLNHSRESKDIFLDFYEKLIEPCLQNNWSRSDVEASLTAYKMAAASMEFIRGSPHLQPVWERYMSTLRQCVVQMYPR